MTRAYLQYPESGQRLLKNTVGAGNALIDGIIDIGEPFNRFVKHQRCGNEREESSRGGIALK